MDISVTEIPVILNEITVNINDQSEQEDICGTVLSDINDYSSDVLMSETGTKLEIASWRICGYIAAPRHRTDGVVLS